MASVSVENRSNEGAPALISCVVPYRMARIAVARREPLSGQIIGIQTEFEAGDVSDVQIID